MEKILIIFWSGTGNTAIMAEEIAKGIKEANKDTDIFTVDQWKGNITDYTKIAFGCSAMGDEVLEESEFEPFFESIENNLNSKKIALFGSYGWGDGQWMRAWTKRLEDKGITIYDEGLIINGTPDTEGQNQCQQFGKGFAAF